MNNAKYKIDLIDDNELKWGNIEISEDKVLIGMYEDGKIERKLFTIDRNQARQLVKILDAFINELL